MTLCARNLCPPTIRVTSLYSSLRKRAPMWDDSEGMWSTSLRWSDETGLERGAWQGDDAEEDVEGRLAGVLNGWCDDMTS